MFSSILSVYKLCYKNVTKWESWKMACYMSGCYRLGQRQRATVLMKITDPIYHIAYEIYTEC